MGINLEKGCLNKEEKDTRDYFTRKYLINLFYLNILYIILSIILYMVSKFVNDWFIVVPFLGMVFSYVTSLYENYWCYIFNLKEHCLNPNNN